MAMNIAIKTDRDGKFIDLYNSDDLMRITDYSLMNREVVIDGNAVVLGEKKKRLQVTSVDGLKKCIEVFLQVALSILAAENVINYASYDLGEEIVSSALIDFNINDAEQQLLVEQIVVDVLFDKYLNEAEKMTHSKYASYMSSLLNDGTNNILFSDSTRKSIKRSLTQYYQMMKYSQLREEIALLGFDPDKYADYYNPSTDNNIQNKKPKFVWDQLYYNRNLITYRQYRRQLSRSSRNYSYEEILSDLKEYRSFVDKLLPRDNTEPKQCFNRVMDYYALETYKRIDFMLLLTNVMLAAGLAEVDRITFLAKRFHPQVLMPCAVGNEINYGQKVKYYRPAIMLEKTLLQQTDIGKENRFTYIGIQMLKCQIIRAKVYEMLSFHIEFTTSDYSGIKGFLQRSYDMCSYHRENELWDTIVGSECSWRKKTVEEKRDIKELIKKFILLNEAFFRPSEKRNIHLPQDE